jgi:hypothetical protein
MTPKKIERWIDPHVPEAMWLVKDGKAFFLDLVTLHLSNSILDLDLFVESVHFKRLPDEET